MLLKKKLRFVMMFRFGGAEGDPWILATRLAPGQASSPWCLPRGGG
ncbi:hypothetical protein FM101_00090 [Arthrobacter rhombi]|uniref:Uncharacterized protein n=1 Tax=Arthrobacter rhombi TaxID=71253 RepID=A0A1R4EPC8_9MICC|nr:hypothetical protein FM101_00090 [Arthrobacter rhombi]